MWNYTATDVQHPSIYKYTNTTTLSADNYNQPHYIDNAITQLQALQFNKIYCSPLIRCIESDIGQNSKELADALNRTLSFIFPLSFFPSFT